MAYTPREIKDRVAVGDDIFIIEDLGDNRVRLIPAPTHVLEVGTPINKALLQPIEDYLATGVVPVERRIIAGSGLSGGGSLDADRTLSVKFGTTAGTVCEGNDYRLSNARPPTAHDHDDRYYTKSQFNTHMDATSGVHGATSSATANRLIIRDSNGRASVADPTSASHIATKGYVDGLVGSLQAGTAFAYYLTPPNVELSSSNEGYDNWWDWDATKSVVVRILLPGTIRYHVQYRSHGDMAAYVRVLLNGSQIREVSTSSTSWQTVTGNITVNPGDIVTIQKRTNYSGRPAYWRNVRIETTKPPLGIQRF